MDLADDGYPDVVAFSYAFGGADPEPAGRVLVWRNDRNGDLLDATRAVFGERAIIADHTRDVEVFDANGDGLDDVFAGQHGWDLPPFPGAPDLLLIQDAEWRLLDRSSSVVPNEGFGEGKFTHSLTYADVDCDADMDVYQGNITGGLFPRIMLNDGRARSEQPNRRLYQSRCA